MRRVRSRPVLRLPPLAVALAVAVLSLGLGASPASALNHNTYNILRNADLHQYCLDIRTQDAPDGASAQLWTCTHPVVGEQLFILVGDGFGHDHIKVRRSGYCLERGRIGEGVMRQHPCDFASNRQSWDLRDTGEIVNVSDGFCLTPLTPDQKATGLALAPCNGTIAQRWFF